MVTTATAEPLRPARKPVDLRRREGEPVVAPLLRFGAAQHAGYSDGSAAAAQSCTAVALTQRRPSPKDDRNAGRHGGMPARRTACARVPGYPQPAVSMAGSVRADADATNGNQLFADGDGVPIGVLAAVAVIVSFVLVASDHDPASPESGLRGAAAGRRSSREPWADPVQERAPPRCPFARFRVAAMLPNKAAFAPEFSAIRRRRRAARRCSASGCFGMLRRMRSTVAGPSVSTSAIQGCRSSQSRIVARSLGPACSIAANRSSKP